VQAEYWVKQLAQEMEQRLRDDTAENKRHASLFTLHFSFVGGHKSKVAHLQRHDAATMAGIAMGHLRTWMESAAAGWAITGLSMTAGNFHGATAASGSIKRMFAHQGAQAPAAPDTAASGSHSSAAPPAAAMPAERLQLPASAEASAAQLPSARRVIAAHARNVLAPGRAESASKTAPPGMQHDGVPCDQRPGVEHGPPACVHASGQPVDHSHAADAQPSEMDSPAAIAADSHHDAGACEPAEPGRDRSHLQRGHPAAAARLSDNLFHAGSCGDVAGISNGAGQKSCTPATGMARDAGLSASAAGSTDTPLRDALPPAPDEGKVGASKRPRENETVAAQLGDGARVDAVLLAQLPTDLRSEVYLQSGRPGAGHKLAMGSQKTSKVKVKDGAQRGMASFLNPRQ
jgi:hypothetical protein